MSKRRYHFITRLTRWHKPLAFFLALGCIGLCFRALLFFHIISHPSGSETMTTSSLKSSPRVGLKADGKYFTLDGKQLTILSGAIHYFRVVPEYWEDRLLKLRALGLNTVET